VEDELEEAFVDLLADGLLDTGHVLEGLVDLSLAHLLTLGGSGLLATVMDFGGDLLGDLDLGDLLLGRLLLLGRFLLLLGGLAGLAGFTLEERGHDEIGVSLRFGKRLEKTRGKSCE